MARAIMDAGGGGGPRRVHLFDSFQGIPKPGPEDHEFIQSGNPAGSACCPMEDVQRNARAFGIPDSLLVYHPGWFADTMPKAIDYRNTPPLAQLALLRLDADLYESTKTALTYLYPLLSRGGWLIVDDYPLSGCRAALHETVGYLQPSYFQKLT